MYYVGRLYMYMTYACVFGSTNVCLGEVDHHDVMQYDVMTFYHEEHRPNTRKFPILTSWEFNAYEIYGN